MRAESGSGATHQARRWAQLALVAVLAAVLLVLAAAGYGSVLALLIGILGLALGAAGVWWAVSRHGLQRFGGAVLAVGAPAAVLALYILTGLWVFAVAVLALWALALACARLAVRRLPRPRPMAPRETPPPRRPVLIMNPESGGGKVEKFGLADRARALGAQVHLLDPARPTDVDALARQAVADGADLLGVAGGDGTQALVAAVAAEHGLPFLVVSAGTRNHFAMDLGLDRADPARCLDALTDGVELLVDLGEVAGRPFVNTVSFGLYAAIVQSPEYREAKAGTALAELPGLIGDGSGLRASADGTTLTAPQALLVSNNPYAGADDPLGGARRPRLDGGTLGLLAITVASAADAARLALLGTQARGLDALTVRQVEVTADQPELPVAVDGEALTLPTPVRCRIRPAALRVRVPRHRPGAAATAPPPVRWRQIVRLAIHGEAPHDPAKH
ncbi:diacylglycerol/lipid kinase family protein [Kitasatospora sp. NPDC006697]|uniref:diacylglycerol/lipid kinase family protein n=1 Tax=Kitasatospora sp. NPDC006697 TaxID=3364020 RepID=UPI00369D0BFC